MQFDFGQNWINFSQKSLNQEKVETARKDFAELMRDIPMAGKSFLDIGFGQGLSLLFSCEAGAKVSGTDINPKCREALQHTQYFFRNEHSIPIVVGSILEPDCVQRILALSPQGNGFDVVHSWGVLHHTGNMKKAIQNASVLVARGGYLVLAIYNRHFSSRIWLGIKWSYNKAPVWLKNVMVATLFPIIWVAKLIATGKNPLAQARGMDFYYNVIDWVGGYPYEYANRDEVVHLVEPLGFRCIRFFPAKVPTGCNEFIFRRVS